MFKGFLVSMITLVVSFIFISFFLTLLLTFITIKTETLYIIFAIIYLCIFLLGGIIAGYYSSKKGWLIGICLGFTGILFTSILKSYIPFSTFSFVYISFSSFAILIAMVGGMIGVNFSSKPAKT